MPSFEEVRMIRRVGLLLSCWVFLACATRDTGSVTKSSCKACVATTDCTQELCVQMEGDSVCAGTCNTDADCVSGDQCAKLTTSDGKAMSACIARDGSCGKVPMSGDASDGGTNPCTGFSAPDVANTCCACTSSHGGCAANNCFGGYYCNVGCVCVPPPSQCTNSSSGGADAVQTGGSVTASVDGAKGGTANRLYFAIVGDTRPANIDDTAHYPTAIITSIYSAIARLNPMPEFVLATGDYVYASTQGSESVTQLKLYTDARAGFHGPLWATMGNHECDGFTRTNCANRSTSNFDAFVTSMLQPIGESKPWYVRRVDAPDGSWTAKFIIVAANWWNSTERDWLNQQLSAPTTYTFVIRHEPSSAPTAPGINDIDAAVSAHPVTLVLEGHTHTWRHDTGSKEVIIGNGGAPATGGVPPGYTIVSQQADKSLVISNYDSSNGHALSTFAVKPDGTSAP
jgi:hypothetical protein